MEYFVFSRRREVVANSTSAMLRPSYTIRETARHGLVDELQRHVAADPDVVFQEDEVSLGKQQQLCTTTKNSLVNFPVTSFSSFTPPLTPTYLDMLIRLLNGLVVHAGMQDGETPLHVAAAFGKCGVVEWLLKAQHRIAGELNLAESQQQHHPTVTPTQHQQQRAEPQSRLLERGRMPPPLIPSTSNPALCRLPWGC